MPPPRAPLAVRRPTPAPPPRPRQRAAPDDDGVNDLGLDALAVTPPAQAQPDPHAGAVSDADAGDRRAGGVAHPARRLLAAGADLALLAGIDAAVLYFTLRVCELEVSQLAVLPPVPMAAFFAILNGGYLVLFTGMFGQTLGKMMAGIEVVAQDLAPIDLERALYRVIVSLLSLLTAGLGFLPALVGEGRSLHDRIAHTRVVAVRPSPLRS
ncbi:MAG: RDD family protein [Acidobacteriota bacterium]